MHIVQKLNIVKPVTRDHFDERPTSDERPLLQ